MERPENLFQSDQKGNGHPAVTAWLVVTVPIIRLNGKALANNPPTARGGGGGEWELGFKAK